MNYSLRKASSSDLNFIIKLIELTFKDLMLENGELWDIDEQKEMWGEKLKNESHNIIIYEQQDIWILSLQEWEDEIYLDLLFILPKHQRKWIATEIVKTLKLKNKNIILRTLISNTPAKDFFMRQKFEFIKEENNRIYLKYNAWKKHS